MCNRTLRRLSLLLSLVLLLSVGGVYATWQYAHDPVQSKSTDLNPTMDVFDYPPEEVLPGGDENQEDDKEEVDLNNTNHFSLIDLLLNAEKGYGLNRKNSFLYELLEDDGVVYSNQHVTGGNLKFVLDDKNNTSGLYYCVEWISETECHAYTFTVAELATAGGSVTEIVAYKTILVKTDQWRATTSYKGYAPTIALRDLGVSGGSQADIYFTIDMSKWHT